MPPASRRNRLPASLAAGLVLAVAASLPPEVSAHDALSAYVQHQVAVRVSRNYVDVTVVLTFFEDGSEHEREDMDANGDGQISRHEVEVYLAGLEPTLSAAVSLRAGKTAVPLIPLCSPEPGLLGNDRVGRGHHRLSLRWFAPTPPQLEAGTRLTVEDRLWPAARALVSVRAEGADGCQVEALDPGEPLLPPARNGEARTFEVRVLRPPPAPPPEPDRAPPRAPLKSALPYP